LRFAAKDLERNAKKSEKMEKEEKVKLKKVGNILLQLRDTTVSHYM